MNPTVYKQRHPLAWIVIGGVLLFAGVAAAGLNGWLPFGERQVAVCNACGVVESVRTVETPMAAPATALEQSVTDDATAPTDAAGTAPDLLEPAAETQVSLSYETTIRYDNGTTGVFSQADPPTWAPADKVKVVDGLILVAS